MNSKHYCCCTLGVPVPHSSLLLPLFYSSWLLPNAAAPLCSRHIWFCSTSACLSSSSYFLSRLGISTIQSTTPLFTFLSFNRPSQQLDQNRSCNCSTHPTSQLDLCSCLTIARHPPQAHPPLLSSPFSTAYLCSILPPPSSLLPCCCSLPRLCSAAFPTAIWATLLALLLKCGSPSFNSSPLPDLLLLLQLEFFVWASIAPGLLPLLPQLCCYLLACGLLLPCCYLWSNWAESWSVVVCVCLGSLLLLDPSLAAAVWPLFTYV